MNLIIEAGNTLVKAALFEDGRLIKIMPVTPTVKDFKKIIEEYPNISSTLICDVRGIEWDFLNTIINPKNIYILNSSYTFPFKTKYKTPNTLGMDRLGLMTAAATQYANTNVLVIDLGTCITYDLLTKENEYIGGMISPGYTMRYKSLNKFTGKLPLVPHEDIKLTYGNDTQTSIQAGVFNGIFYEVQGQIDYFSSKYEHLTIILTGGDSQILSKRLKNSIFANPNFLIEGLNYILEINKQ